MDQRVLPSLRPTLGDAREETGVLPNFNTPVLSIRIQKHRGSHNSFAVMLALNGPEIGRMLTASKKAPVSSHVYLR
jgi:hypothetical protein